MMIDPTLPHFFLCMKRKVYPQRKGQKNIFNYIFLPLPPWINLIITHIKKTMEKWAPR